MNYIWSLQFRVQRGTVPVLFPGRAPTLQMTLPSTQSQVLTYCELSDTPQSSLWGAVRCFHSCMLQLVLQEWWLDSIEITGKKLNNTILMVLHGFSRWDRAHRRRKMMVSSTIMQGWYAHCKRSLDELSSGLSWVRRSRSRVFIRCDARAESVAAEVLGLLIFRHGHHTGCLPQASYSPQL